MARGPKLITRLGLNDREFNRKLEKAGQSAIAWSKKVATGAVGGALGLGAGGLLGGRNTFFSTDVGQSIKAAKILEPQNPNAAAMLRHGDEALSLVGADGDGQFRQWATALRDAAKRAMTGDHGANIAFRRLGIADSRAAIGQIADSPVSALSWIAQKDRFGGGIWQHQDFETLGLGELRGALKLDRFTAHMRRRQDPDQHSATFSPQAEQRYWDTMRAIRGLGIWTARGGEHIAGAGFAAADGALADSPASNMRTSRTHPAWGGNWDFRKHDPYKHSLRPNGG